MARIIDDDMSDYEKQQRMIFKIIIITVVVVIVGLFALIMIFGSFYTVGAGERAIVLTFQKPSDVVQGSGLHFKIPIIQSIVLMNVRTQTIHFDNQAGKGDIAESSSLFSASKDLQDVQIATVVNYHIAEGDVLQIYKQYGDSNSFQSNILEPVVRDSVKTISATYTAEELVSKRAEFNDKVASLLQERFTQKSAVFEKINIVNFQFSESFTNAIERKVTAEQDALAQKNKLEQVKYEAEQRVTQAKGEAEAIKIQAQAVTQQGGKNYVQLQLIQKWNGVSPQIVVVSDGSNPIAPFLQLQTTSTSTSTTTK